MKFEESQDYGLLESFLFYLSVERNLAQNTIISYKFDVVDLIKFLHTKRQTLESATYFNVVHFFEFLMKERSLEPATQLRKLSVFFNFYEFLKTEKGLQHNPIEEFERPKNRESLPIFLEENETSTLLETAKKDISKDGIRNYAVLELLYSSGMRISEALQIKLSNILTPKGQLKNSCIIVGKGGRERLVFINNSAKDAIKNLIEVRPFFPNAESGFLFNAKSKQGFLTRQNFFYSLKKIAYAAGLEVEKISPHKIRHSFATHLFLNGIDLSILQVMLGHADVSTTQIYTHINSSTLKKQVQDFHPLAKGL